MAGRDGYVVEQGKGTGAIALLVTPLAAEGQCRHHAELIARAECIGNRAIKAEIQPIIALSIIAFTGRSLAVARANKHAPDIIKTFMVKGRAGYQINRAPNGIALSIWCA